MFKLLVEPISPFKAFKLFKNCDDSLIYIPVYFSGTHCIKAENSKISLYNPETGKSFDFVEPTEKLLNNKGKYMEGIAIAEITILKNKIFIRVENTILCKYLRYSRSERYIHSIKIQQYIRQYYEQDDLYDYGSYAGYNMYQDNYYGEYDDYSDKYRAYESIEEFCDEYEQIREFEVENGSYF